MHKNTNESTHVNNSLCTSKVNKINTIIVQKQIHWYDINKNTVNKFGISQWHRSMYKGISKSCHNYHDMINYYERTHYISRYKYIESKSNNPTHPEESCSSFLSCSWQRAGTNPAGCSNFPSCSNLPCCALWVKAGVRKGHKLGKDQNTTTHTNCHWGPSATTNE